MSDTAKPNQHIIEGIEPKYFARIPNMAVDDLNYAELALYVHYKRVASDRGRCYQSTKQIAKKLHMGQPKLRKTRDALVAKGLIAVAMRMNEDDIECNSRLITIVNVWEENIKRYAPPHQTDIPPSTNGYTPMSKLTYEEELKEEEPKKKKKDCPPTADAGDSSNRVGQQPLTDKSKLDEQPNPFQDKNHPDATTTPLIPEEKLPPANGFTHKPRTELPDGEEYNNGEVKPGPMQGGKRSTLPQEGDKARIGPTITRPTFPIEASDYAQEDEPKAEEEAPPTPQQMFGAICGVLGWDTNTVPKKKKARIGKCSKDLIEVNAPLWKLAKMQEWAMKKFGAKWNMPYNLGGPEKVVEFWPTYWGETIDQNTITITVPIDPTPLLKNDTSPLISPIMQKLVVAKIAAVARDKTIPDFDPEKDDPNETAEERHRRKQAELYERLAIDAGLPIDDNPFKP